MSCSCSTDRRIDASAVEQQERRHRSVGDALVTVDEGMALGERKAQGAGLHNQVRVQIGSSEGCSRLGHGRCKGAKVPDARGAPAHRQDEAMQLNHLAQRQVTHQASRRYNSRYLWTTRAAAAVKSSAGAANTSATTALANSSGETPSRSASRRSCSLWAADNSMLSFMPALYRGGAPSNKPLERPGMTRSQPGRRASAGRSAPSR